MRKTILLIIILGGSCNVKAQSFIGFLTENYAGVNSVIVNPANIVDSRFRADINLFGISAFGVNDYYNLNIRRAINDASYDTDADSRYTPKLNNNGEGNVDFMGPSFMFNLNSNNSMAVFTRARSFVRINGVNGIDIYNSSLEETTDYTIVEDDLNVFGQAWAEIGLSFARVLTNNRENFLKGGISIKYLRGLGSTYLAGNNVIVDYDADGAIHSDGGTTGSFTSIGNVVYGRFDDIDSDDYEYDLPINANGLGIDIGIIYEWRPTHGNYKPRKVWPNRLTYKEQNKYKLKLGLSITDIGAINYENGTEYLFDVTNTNVSEEALDNEDNIYDILNNLYTLTNTTTSYKAILPTALHLNADWSFTNKLYLNFNTDLSLISKSQLRASKITNIVSLTPRFESKWFSAYVPFSLVQYAGFQAGAGFRLGPLYMGSSSLFSNLLSNKSKGSNFYAGLKIPLFHGKYDNGNDCDCY